MTLTWTWPLPTWCARSCSVVWPCPHPRAPTLARARGSCGPRPSAVRATSPCCSTALEGRGTGVGTTRMRGSGAQVRPGGGAPRLGPAPSLTAPSVLPPPSQDAAGAAPGGLLPGGEPFPLRKSCFCGRRAGRRGSRLWGQRDVTPRAAQSPAHTCLLGTAAEAGGELAEKGPGSPTLGVKGRNSRALG